MKVGVFLVEKNSGGAYHQALKSLNILNEINEINFHSTKYLLKKIIFLTKKLCSINIIDKIFSFYNSDFIKLS